MGLSLFRISLPAAEVETYATQLGDPDPKNYYISQKIVIGEFLIMKIKYYGCVNYEGQKILVFENVRLSDIESQGWIDPHFSDSKKGIYPMARFEPKYKGWRRAIHFCETLKF